MPIFDNGQMGLMPGETYGIPNQSGGYGGLLSGDNQLLNIGLGILANNNSKNTAQVLGRGALQGINQTQQAQQLAQQRKMQEYQMKDYERKQQEYDRQQKALEAFKVKFPEYGEAVELDPKLAIKAAYPKLASNSADPYYNFLPTANGYASGNARTGEVRMVLDANGMPIVKASDSPTLQGQIAGAKAGAEADYKINTDLPGQVNTARQVAMMADPTLANMQPQQQMAPPIPRGTPMMPQGNFNGNPQAIMSQINRISDPQERAQATQAFQQQYGQQAAPQQAPMSNNLVGGGIRVPTPAEQALLTEQAKASVDVQKQSELNTQKRQESASKGQQSLNAMMKYLYKDGVPVRDSNGRLTVPEEPPVLGNSITDRATMLGHEYGIHNDKASNIIGARRLINSLVLDANNGSLGAGVSNADVQFLQKIQGVIDSAQDPKDIYNAIADNEDRFNRILGVAQQQGTNTATGVPTKKSVISGGGWSAKKVP